MCTRLTENNTSVQTIKAFSHFFIRLPWVRFKAIRRRKSKLSVSAAETLSHFRYHFYNKWNEVSGLIDMSLIQTAAWRQKHPTCFDLLSGIRLEPVTTKHVGFKKLWNHDAVKRRHEYNESLGEESGWTSRRNPQDECMCVCVCGRVWTTAARDPTWLSRFRSQGSPSGGGGWHNLYSLKEIQKKIDYSLLVKNRWNTKLVHRTHLYE